MERTDIVIAGGGTAGLAAAAGFGSLGLGVVILDPVGDGGDDGRTTAILAPGRKVLEAVGVWPFLATETTPLRIMRVVDAGPAGPAVARDFDSGDLGDAPFGWNVPNRALRRALGERLAALPGVSRRPLPFAARLAREAEAVVTIGDGARVASRLLVGADGRDSAVRAACGIGATTLRYGQTALVFAVTHDAPHGNVSTEVHARGGPFTLVPLPDRDGRPCSSVVWMTDGSEAARLIALAPDAFAAAVDARSAGLMGPLVPVGERQAWPVVTRLARAMTARRTALMAEAAHAVPPIGAQGLNMSLADLGTLLDLARGRPEGIGDDAWLSAYARAREGDVRLRALGIDVLNRVSIAGLGPLRALGLRALHDVAPLRRGLMRLGLGA